MSFALSAAVTGMQVHQSMLDVAGNNLANVNTTGFKASNVTFSDLLSQTIKSASGPSGSLGGTNPQQKGSGVQVANIVKDMTQGNISNTGQDLDCAIDGAGYFVLSNGEQTVYSRIGSFAVDVDNNLVDPATGYMVQRMVATTDNFQTAGTTNIHIPYDTAMPANATTTIEVQGNLRSSAEATAATYQKSTADTAWTTGSGAAVADGTTLISALDGFTAGAGAFAGGAGTLTVTYTDSTGTTGQTALINVTAATDVSSLISDISTALGDSTVTIDSNGYLVCTADAAGYSQTQITNLAYANAGGGSTETWDPQIGFFDMNTYGGEDHKAFNITIYDSLGDPHVLTGHFVKTTTANTWDLVVGDIADEQDKTWTGYNPTYRRIEDVTFGTDGSYAGTTNSLQFSVTFTNGSATPQAVTFDLGTIGEFSGLTQFASEESTAGAWDQDGYEAGNLTSVNIDQGGMLAGIFSNGERQDICKLLMAVFQNNQGLEAQGNGYYLPSDNSGEPMETTATNGGAGSIRSKALEKSNVDVATQFVNLMTAQNGFQANARTIRVASTILQELAGIVR